MSCISPASPWLERHSALRLGHWHAPPLPNVTRKGVKVKGRGRSLSSQDLKDRPPYLAWVIITRICLWPISLSEFVPHLHTMCKEILRVGYGCRVELTAKKIDGLGIASACIAPRDGGGVALGDTIIGYVGPEKQCARC